MGRVITACVAVLLGTLGTTITGDFTCRATNVDYRLDTASARSFLGQFVALP